MNTPIDPATPAVTAPTTTAREFTVFRQRLNLEFDFLNQAVKGQTEILLIPQSKTLRQIRLNCRQCDIQSTSVEDRPANFLYHDPYKHLKPHAGWGVRQHHLYKERLEGYLGDNAREELVIDVPKKVVVREASSLAATSQENSLNKPRMGIASIGPMPDTPTLGTAELQADYLPLTVKIAFTLKNARDGLQFIGLAGGDNRYPNVYTRNTPHAGSACCLFPCVDDLTERSEWEITVKCPKTLGDALGLRNADPAAAQLDSANVTRTGDGHNQGFSEAERALELSVVCSGQLDDESEDPLNPLQKIVTFSTHDVYCSANQIGFAIGPFEQVDLSDLREVDEDDKLAEDAVQVTAYCLPGRAEEVKNTALPMAKAVDFFTERFTKYFYPNYCMCFLDDLVSDTVINAGLSFISTRLLFPPDIQDPIYDNTHKVVYALAAQYSGIGVTAREAADNWCIIGMAYFMADVFMRHLCGNNEYRFRQKLAVDRIFELDRERPSLHSLGSLLQLDPSEKDFVSLKAATVLFILDRRLTKSSTSSGVARVINRTLTNTKGGDAEATLLSTAQFQKTCERTGHTKLDSFFNQWVYGAGCPNFQVSQRFNKKKLVVEMVIEQMQSKPEKQQQTHDLNPDFFLRDVNEELNEVWASQQTIFTGPMTIRIHEADGTPYEHIVDIKEASQKLEIPYNTKYKRLKRNRRQKERQGGNVNTNQENTTGEDKDEVLLYCLGDVLQTEEEAKEWKLQDWTSDQEKEMSDDSYEWIRMDADFEWICKMKIQMPPWMYVSQLQQDRDVVAQYESLQYIGAQQAHPLIATFLARTIMDSRYFHGIRTHAISLLPKQAQDQLGWIGLHHLRKIYSELFCTSDTLLARANDFSNRSLYVVQCALAKAMARIRNNMGVVPMSVKRFFVDTLKFNDNSQSEYSDCYWVATLMTCLAEVLVTPPGYPPVTLDEEQQEEEDAFRKDAISEIERYRRIDEWISSFQNLYSVTALQCLLRLSRASILHPKLADFLQYTREGNADQLRIQAFRCLTDLGKLKHGPILKYMLHSTSHDASPYMREQCFSILARGLGLVAMGQDKPAKPNETVSEGLVIEEGSTDERAQDLARRTTIDGAIKALKEEMGNNEALQQGLWDAVTSTIPSIRELWRYLTVPEILYDTESKLIVVFKYPRYWQLHYEGDGLLRLTNDGRVRTQPRRPVAAAPASVPNTIKLNKPTGPTRKPSMKLSLGRQPSISSDGDSLASAPLVASTVSTSQNMPPPSQRPTAALEKSGKVERTPDVERKPAFVSHSLVVKLKVPKMRDVAYVASLAGIVPRPSSTPDPAPKKLKLNTGATNIKKESTSPTLTTAGGTLSAPLYNASTPSGQPRRPSTASSRSSGSGKRGGKRKSGERDAAGDYFGGADGTLSPEAARKKQKAHRNGQSASVTPVPQYAPISTPTPSQQFGAWDATQYGPANGDDGGGGAAQYGAWNDSLDPGDPVVTAGDAPTAAPVVLQSPTPSRLVVKLRLPKRTDSLAMNASNPGVSPACAPKEDTAGVANTDGAADVLYTHDDVNGNEANVLSQDIGFAPVERASNVPLADRPSPGVLTADGNDIEAPAVAPLEEGVNDGTLSVKASVPPLTDPSAAAAGINGAGYAAIEVNTTELPSASSVSAEGEPKAVSSGSIDE